MLTLEKARAWYPEYDGVHGFDHIERVYGMCEVIGLREGADLEILRAAALLHDARCSHPVNGERTNHHIESAEFAERVLLKEGWELTKIRAVQHCIISHRFREKATPETIEAKVLFDADKLDVVGAVGVVRALAYASQVKQPAYATPSNEFLKNGTKLPGEPHSAYHEYIYKLRKISELLFTQTARQIAQRRQAFLNEFFEELKMESEIDKPRRD
jgi:uncharacterized protein